MIGSSAISNPPRSCDVSRRASGGLAARVRRPVAAGCRPSGRPAVTPDEAGRFPARRRRERRYSGGYASEAYRREPLCRRDARDGAARACHMPVRRLDGAGGRRRSAAAAACGQTALRVLRRGEIRPVGRGRCRRHIPRCRGDLPRVHGVRREICGDGVVLPARRVLGVRVRAPRTWVFRA